MVGKKQQYFGDRGHLRVWKRQTLRSTAWMAAVAEVSVSDWLTPEKTGSHFALVLGNVTKQSKQHCQSVLKMFLCISTGFIWWSCKTKRIGKVSLGKMASCVRVSSYHHADMGVRSGCLLSQLPLPRYLPRNPFQHLGVDHSVAQLGPAAHSGDRVSINLLLGFVWSCVIAGSGWSWCRPQGQLN